MRARNVRQPAGDGAHWRSAVVRACVCAFAQCAHAGAQQRRRAQQRHVSLMWGCAQGRLRSMLALLRATAACAHACARQRHMACARGSCKFAGMYIAFRMAVVSADARATCSAKRRAHTCSMQQRACALAGESVGRGQRRAMGRTRGGQGTVSL